MKFKRATKKIYLCPRCGGELISNEEDDWYKCDGKAVVKTDKEGEWHCAMSYSYAEIVDSPPLQLIKEK